MTYETNDAESTIPANTYYDVVVVVPANVVGTYDVTFNNVRVANEYGSNLLATEATVTATITVEEPAAPAAPYEIYYELNKTVDELNDDRTAGTNKYAEYDVAKDTVTAEIFIVSNNADVTLQAYDIYLSHDPKLTYTGQNLTNGLAYTNNGQLTHIQAVGTDPENPESPISIALTQGVAKSLGTITFSFGNGVAYNSKMPITLTVGSNSRTVTNIGVANANGGDKASYYPANTSEMEGVEPATYTVTYNANGGSGAPAAQVKNYKVDLTLSNTVPTRANFVFNGWNTAADGTGTAYAKGATYAADASTTLYAQWKAATYTVTWKSQDGTTTYETDTGLALGAKPSFDQADPSKTPSAQYTYTFLGWATDPNQTSGGVLEENLSAVSGDVTYYAVFSSTVNKYNVIFNANGHGTAPATQNIEYNGTATAPTAPTATGYTFGGWYTDAGCTNAYNFSTPVTGEITLYAKWTANKVDVILNHNYAGSVNGSTEVTYGSGYTGLTSPSRTGYTFDGWYTAATGGDEVTGATIVNNANEHTLYAHWTPIRYTVVYNANGATSGTAPQSATVNYDASITIPGQGDLVKTNWVFLGWAKDQSATVAEYTANQSVSGLSTAAGSTVTLYAVWVQNVYNITYTHNVDGNVDPNFTVGSTLVPAYTKGTTLAIANPTTVGYTFGGWTSTKLGINTATMDVTIPDTTIGDVDLTAHWTINEHTITFKNTDGSKIHTITQNYGTAVSAPADPEKEGHTFAGWSAEIPDTMPDEDVVITATWTVNQYTIKFANTGDSTINDITLDYGTTVPTVSDPTKVGYTFTGWDMEIPGTMPVTADGGLIITAQWIENQYTIRFDTTGTDSTIEDKTVGYDDPVTLPSATKPGHVLTGWTDKADPAVGATPKYPIANPVSELKTGVVGDNEITLYPVWKYDEYTVSFDLGAHPADDAQTPADITVTYNNVYPELTDVTPANGYTFDGWFIGNTKIEAGDTVTITDDTTLVAKYTVIPYTITFDTDGGNTIDPVGYNIESDYTLPKPTKANCTFNGWKPEVAADGWQDGSYNAGTSVAGKYGNVKLVAQWTENVSYVIEDYAYANGDYVMLRVKDDVTANSKVYQFGTQVMYYTTDGNYKLAANDTGVFYTLISKEYVKMDGTRYAGLTDDGLEALAAVSGSTTTINYNGDINGDGVVNIADANVVYQMIRVSGDYYNDLGSDSQDNILSRLKADMVKDGADHRGSIEDVNAIVTTINA